MKYFENCLSILLVNAGELDNAQIQEKLGARSRLSTGINRSSADKRYDSKSMLLKIQILLEIICKDGKN